MNPRGLLAPLLGALLLATGCQHGKGARPTTPEGHVRAVLGQQVADWNAGSIDGFMRGYARTAGTRFASGGEVTRGWQTVLDRYVKRYGDRAAMGRLAFSDVEVTELSPTSALVFGHWRLEREKDRPEGLFTLLFLLTPDGWRIVHDHTSSATP